MPWLNLLLAAMTVATAWAVRPWRAVHAIPSPALAWWVLLPLFWSVDLLSAQPVLQPLAGSCLLMLMLGWPLAVLMLLPVAAGVLLLADATLAEALHRLVWLGLVPMTLALGLGAALRRWLPNHLFVYILGRSFFATGVAVSVAGALSAALHGAPPGSGRPLTCVTTSRTCNSSGAPSSAQTTRHLSSMPVTSRNSFMSRSSRRRCKACTDSSTNGSTWVVLSHSASAPQAT